MKKTVARSSSTRSKGRLREGRIERLFQTLALRNQKAFIPYLMAGDPTLDETEALVKGLAEIGADMIELGVPFSDPIADGPVIQRASVRSLEQKTTLPAILQTVKTLRNQGVGIPLVLMSYYNPVLKYGENGFVRDAVASGVDGLIVPDLPPEEAETLMKAADAEGLDLIFLMAPTTRPVRMKKVAESGRGFLYYVSLVGITGAKMGSVRDIQSQIQKLRQATALPIAIGFGISTPEEAGRAAALGEGVVVGSALVRQIEAHLEDGKIVPSVLSFGRSLLSGIRKSPPG